MRIVDLKGTDCTGRGSWVTWIAGICYGTGVVKAPSVIAMVQQAAGHAFTPLRAISQRLTSTPAKQLPHIVPYLANALTSCGDQLSEPESHSRAKDGSDAAVLVHKYKTQISTLLQEKSVESRWAAVVLINATIEVGGWEILHGAGPWTRGLLGILGVCRYLFTQRSSTRWGYIFNIQRSVLM